MQAPTRRPPFEPPTSDGTNHWIPFTESEVGAKDCFKSHFMSDYLAGKVKAGKAAQGELALGEAKDTIKLSHAPLESLSTEAKAVMDAGRELWRYYHLQPNANPDASYYDIRLHFQGSVTDSKGKVRMNNDSSDEQYTELVGNLRSAMKKLARHIERKVYEYGFLRR